MKVDIKNFDVAMSVENKGVELAIRSPKGDEFLGNCVVTKTGIAWKKGKTRTENSKVTWKELMTICDSIDTLKAAVDAAKEVTKLNNK